MIIFFILIFLNVSIEGTEVIKCIGIFSKLALDIAISLALYITLRLVCRKCHALHQQL